MHVCIVGTGAAGWITAFTLNRLDFVKKITIIGSPAIPTIGVGESTSIGFYSVLANLFPIKKDFFKFLVDIDAALKYGVLYSGWSDEDFLHAFVGFSDINYSGYLLGNLPKDVNPNHYMMPMYDEILKNNITDPSVQRFSFHFDANKLIAAFEKRSKQCSKIEHKTDTVTESVFNEDTLSSIKLSNGLVINADYYVSCVGQTAFNQKIFREEYVDYSDVLLTDKALFCPLQYTDKQKEFHPYTVAKTMKYGWRWITPTWSRIGTGYAFSSKYVSTEEAIKEFTEEIGDTSIKPFEVDFHPRKIKEVFKTNHCSLGMASGFLEPLDAPGLSLLLFSHIRLENILTQKNNNTLVDLKPINQDIDHTFNFWASFILHQYKTSTRNDTQFWIDHKKVKFAFYEKIIENLKNVDVKNDTLQFKDTEFPMLEPWMFYHTSVGKGIRWDVKLNQHPVAQKIPSDAFLENHYECLLDIHKSLENA